MQDWFRALAERDGMEIEADFLKFDGNAQTFRLLTRLQVLNDDFGLNLTVGTLAALIKYPVVYGEDRMGYKKWGVFSSEKAIADEVWTHTGLLPGVRHPLTVVMEACDDIAYSVIDAEDTVKKACASFYDLMDFIESEADDPVSKDIISRARAENLSFKQASLSSRECVKKQRWISALRRQLRSWPIVGMGLRGNSWISHCKGSYVRLSWVVQGVTEVCSAFLFRV